MRIVALSFALGALTGTALGEATATLTALNQCPESVYVVYSTEVSGTYESFSATLGPTSKKITVQLAGEGLSFGVSVDPNFYSDTVAKLIMGYSLNTDDNLLYYSFANDDGNPFSNQPWSLTSDNAQCTSVNSANEVTYACAAGANLSLTFCT